MVPNGPRTVDGKIVLEAKMLDNSHRTLLVEPTSTAGVRSVICIARGARPRTSPGGTADPPPPRRTTRRMCAA
jgi:hypothetical protein